jgi:N-methylhydantoinase B
MHRLKTDPARFEVVKNALTCAAEEMKIVLAKTAYSPLLKVAGDYSCGIFDVQGNMVAQGPDLPIHLGSMPDAVRAVVQAFPDVAPGDVFIHNDPYQGGSHLPDVNVVAPAFHEDRLLGFGCVRAHWPDIGSATPGSYGAVTEIYGEGLRLPPIRLYRDGKPDPAVEAIIFANVRTPTERLGDLRAQVAANWRAAARLQALAAKYGTDTLLDIMQEVQDYSETMMRAALQALPDGEAEFSDVFDGDGIIAPGEVDDETFTVKLRIVKRGDTIIADFAGSAPQVAGPMNAPLTVTASGVFCALKMIADPKSLIPPNSGCWRPVTVTAPPGSVVNAQLPAPVVYANHEISHRVADMVMAAMFAFTPRTVMAGSQGTSAVMTFGGTDYRTNERYVSYESVKGGFGARPVKDGINAVASTVSNMMNTPIEIIEMSFPLRVEEYALVPDSGGAGTWRGGLGVRRVWRVLERQAHAAVCCERTVTPPFGLAGGKPGAPAKPTVGPRSRASFRRPAGRIRYPAGGAPRLRRRLDVREQGEWKCQARNRSSRRRAPIGWMWRPASRTGGAPAARAGTSRSATGHTRAAASRRSSSRRRKPARSRSAAARTAATSHAATGRIGVCST